MQDRRFAGRFLAVERLDSGGSAETFQAVDEVGALFAVDVLHPTDAGDVARLSDSMHAVAAIGHPNIPRVYEWGTDDSGFYVVREHVEGWDLTLLLERGPLDALRVARYGARAASALEAAHEAGLVHGSLSTSRVVVTPEGVVKVLGLGETLTRVLPAGGPPDPAHFLAPELIRGGAPTAESDVYALGAVLYETATSSVPFEAETAWAVADLHVQADPESARRLNPDVPASLEVVLNRALRKDPAERYTSAAAMGQDLERVGDLIQGGEPEREGVLWPTIDLPRWVWITAASVAAVLLLTVGIGGFVWWRRNVTTVPTLVGVAPGPARQQIAAAGLVPGMIVFTHTVDPTLPEGAIATQTPRPGGWARVGSPIGVVINGPRRVLVPEVAGSVEASAIASVQKAGLRIGVIEPVFDAADKGTVVTQTPAAGAPAAVGSAVALSVSQGPKVGAVPSAVGETQASATTAFRGAGFAVTFSTEPNDTVASGNVVSQSPGAGAMAQIGSTVTAVVSSGPPPVAVPAVKGEALGTAITALESAGLKVSASSVKVAATVAGGAKANPAIGQILSQTPAGGASAKAGDTVTITFGLP